MATSQMTHRAIVLQKEDTDGQAIVVPLISFSAAALRGLAFEGSSWGWALLSWASW